MKQDTRKSSGRVSRGKLSTVDEKAVVINLLHQMSWIYGIRGDKRFYILEQNGVLALGRLQRLLHPDAYARMEPPDAVRSVTVRKETQYHTDEYRLQVGEGDSMPHCNGVRRCDVNTAIHLA